MHKTINQIVNFMLAGDHPKLDQLRHQYAHNTKIRSVEITGCGFYVNLDDDSNEDLNAKRIIIGDVMYETKTNNESIGLVTFY